MTLESPSPALAFLASVARDYARLIGTTVACPETGLGGKLFYAGELDGEGRALTVAANIAGAATLAATADRGAQRQAVCDGVADFVVTSLDEALRILKNQLRKRETAAVCVTLAPEAAAAEMRERGVAPDLARSDAEAAQSAETAPQKATGTLTWSVASAPAQWLPRLDAIGLDCLAAEDWIQRRWLRLAPRYLGRMAGGARLLACDREFASRFAERVRMQVERGEIAVGVEIRSSFDGREDKFRFVPRQP